METSRRNLIFGGAIGCVSTIVAGLTVAWVIKPANPRFQEGLVFVRFDRKDPQRNGDDWIYESEMRFYNLRAEISEIRFKIEVMFVDNNPIEFSSEAMDAEVTGIPNRDEVLKFGEARLSIKNFAKGGMVVMKAKSRRSIAMSPELVTSDKPKIAIVSANYLHNYF